MLCTIVSVCASLWYQNALNEHYYIEFYLNVVLNSIINFFSYFLLMNTLLPISLIVTLEVVKVIQSIFIMLDARMYCTERDRYTKVSSTSIIEELG